MSRRNYCLYLLVVSIVSHGCSEKLSIIQVTPRSTADLRFLNHLNTGFFGAEYWKNPRSINETVDIMIGDGKLENLKILLIRERMQHRVQVTDVQKLLNASSPMNSKSSGKVKRQSGGWSSFGWNRFHSLDEIYNWMKSLARAYPRNVRVIEAGRSYEGRPIRGVHLKFGDGRGRGRRRGVFIEAGIHAREWISHATACFVINELVQGSNPEVRWLARAFDWYIFPAVNPDGYVFTQLNPRDASYRLWRKTRSRNFGRQCFGADANRNWAFHWAGPGSSRDACSETFAGSASFSEIEIRNLAKYIDSRAGELFAYLSFHSYIQKLMIPYGHTSAHLDNYDAQFQVGRQAVDALSRRYGTRYQLGNIAQVLGGFASGSSLDWVKANFKVPFVYCYELRGQTSNGQFYGFLAPPSEIIPNGQEVMDSLVALFRAANQYSQY